MPLLKVAQLSQLPADSVTEVTAGDALYAVCNVAGRVTALGGTCPHRGGPLGQGAIHGNFVVCPWHAWEWDCATGANDFDPIGAGGSVVLLVINEPVSAQVMSMPMSVD